MMEKKTSAPSHGAKVISLQGSLKQLQAIDISGMRYGLISPGGDPAMALLAGASRSKGVAGGGGFFGFFGWSHLIHLMDVIPVVHSYL